MKKYFYIVTALFLTIQVSAFAQSSEQGVRHDRVLKNSGLAVVIVDMQYGFYERGGTTDTPGLKSLVAHQLLLIRWAIKNDVPVLFYEYAGFRKTDSRLVKYLDHYRHPHAFVTKDEDGAFDDQSAKKLSLEILKNKWNVDSIIMGGINGGACVKRTALSAIRNGFDVATSSDIVGNINQNPPLYPNSTWYFKDKKFVTFDNLRKIIR